MCAGKEVILLCETGGSLENKSGTQSGFQSRCVCTDKSTEVALLQLEFAI